MIGFLGRPVFFVFVLTLFCALPIFAVPTQQQIDLAINNGLKWLASKQGNDGSFIDEEMGEFYLLASTATAVLAFEDQGNLPGGGQQYSNVVEKGLDLMFQYANVFDISEQEHGNPDSDGDGKAVYFNNSNYMYETGICLMTIMASGKPDRVVSTGPCAGWKYKDVVRDVVDYFSYAQSEVSGGWRYNDNDEYSDNSVTQWPVFGMLMAEEWGIKAPDWVKSELDKWVKAIQDPNTGASGYMSPEDDPNIAKTGGLLTEMFYLNYNFNSAPVQKAIGFINQNDLWEFTKGDSYAMFSAYKGLKVMDVKTLSNLTTKDWVGDYSQWIVDNQDPDGFWNDNWHYGKFLCSGWYIVILEGHSFVQPGIQLTIQANPTSLPADGKATSLITVTVKDKNGKLLSGQNVSLAVTKGKGTLPKTPKDNGNGTYTATYTASTTVGTETITATVSNTSKSVDIKLTQPDTQPARILYIGEVTGVPGKDVTVPIGMNDASGAAGGDMIILYDKSVLAIKEVKTTVATAKSTLQANTTTPGEIIIAIAGSNSLPSGSATLVDMIFTINANAKTGETPITFKKSAVYDATPKDIPISPKNGKVTIGTACVKGDVNNDGEVNAKDAILALRIAAGLLVPNELQKCSADVNSDLAINAKDGIIILRKSAGLPTAPSKVPMPDMITIGFDEVFGIAGDKINVPVRVSKSDMVSAGDIIISYDSKVLKAINVSSENGVLLVYNLSKQGIINIAFASENLINNYEILNISFQVISDGISDLVFKNVKLYSPDTATLKLKAIDMKFTSLLMRPQSSALFQNFPNPFNPETWIPFQLSESGDVTIRIYSSIGELIRQLDLGHKQAGLYTTQDRSAYWDGKDKFGMPVASGIYFYSIQAGNFSAVNKMIILK